MLRPAYSHRLDQLAGEQWLALGDAATTYDPLSGQGIFKALRFGIFAAYAIADSLDGRKSALEKYEHWISSDFEGYLETQEAYYQREVRWSKSPFWQRRHHPRGRHLHAPTLPSNPMPLEYVSRQT